MSGCVSPGFLYHLCGITRQILKEARPDVSALGESVGGIADRSSLNNGLLPFFTKWYPLLQACEARVLLTSVLNKISTTAPRTKIAI